MSALAPAPVASPLGPATVSGTLVTVDTWTNPPTVIPEIVRSLVASNMGYFIEEIFATPGWTIEGGAILYTPTFPQDLFLDPKASLGPRAPGAEAPRIGVKRYVPQIAEPESISGSIEVHDETRRRNKVFVVQNAFQRIANTFADRVQTRGITALNDAVTAWGRIGTGLNWRQAHTGGLLNADPATLPRRDFAKVLNQFIADKAGVRPDVVVLHQDDALYLEDSFAAFGGLGASGFDSLMNRYNLRPLITPLQPFGTALFAKSKQVGVIAFEKPLDQEYTREGTRKTDVYTLEATPAYVALDASAVWRVDGIAG